MIRKLVRPEYDIATEKGFSLIPVPGDPYAKSYRKGATNVWACIHFGRIMWAVATVVNNRYCDHEYFEEIEDAWNAADEQHKKHSGDNENE